MPNVDIPQGIDTGGSPRRQETMGGTPAQNRVTTLENKLSSTKAVYHKAFITLTKRVKKLETQLNQKRSRAFIHSSDEEEPSLDIKDSPKQGRMIGEIEKDDNVNLVSEQGEVRETAKPLKDDDDATLAKTLLNIKRSTTKDKGKDQKEKDVDKGDQTHDIDWNDPEVLRYHALQNRVFSKAKVRKNMCTYLKNHGGYKQSYFKGIKYEYIRPILERKQKLDEQTEEEVEAQVDTDQEFEESVLALKMEAMSEDEEDGGKKNGVKDDGEEEEDGLLNVGEVGGEAQEVLVM
nr:hypothetical protein [Tanacetum cinerariifolium]GEZ90162.1 hypothetical protein [Tanacetum cinerariifolium]